MKMGGIKSVKPPSQVYKGNIESNTSALSITPRQCVKGNQEYPANLKSSSICMHFGSIHQTGTLWAGHLGIWAPGYLMQLKMHTV